mmetsp:Transcript_71821/g.126517  ORF Transcript_71821/g.126517 Transcript_71821/m.126517 type:complete len:234 (+) Transcript_71821:968-1669(+)
MLISSRFAGGTNDHVVLVFPWFEGQAPGLVTDFFQGVPVPLQRGHVLIKDGLCKTSVFEMLVLQPMVSVIRKHDKGLAFVWNEAPVRLVEILPGAAVDALWILGSRVVGTDVVGGLAIPVPQLQPRRRKANYLRRRGSVADQECGVPPLDTSLNNVAWLQPPHVEPDPEGVVDALPGIEAHRSLLVHRLEVRERSEQVIALPWGVGAQDPAVLTMEEGLPLLLGTPDREALPR